MLERASVLLATLVLGSPAPRSEPDVGRRPSARELAFEGSIFADGRGLPPGRGSARDGERVYRAQCAACHGSRGEGSGSFPALVGGTGSLRSPEPQLTVTSYWPLATSLFEYTRRAMPYGAPGTLTADEVYAVSAYVLSLGGVVSQDAVLDQRSLPRMEMPNRRGFTQGSPPP